MGTSSVCRAVYITIPCPSGPAAPDGGGAAPTGAPARAPCRSRAHAPRNRLQALSALGIRRVLGDGTAAGGRAGGAAARLSATVSRDPGFWPEAWRSPDVRNRVGLFAARAARGRDAGGRNAAAVASWARGAALVDLERPARGPGAGSAQHHRPRDRGPADRERGRTDPATRPGPGGSRREGFALNSDHVPALSWLTRRDDPRRSS